MSRRQTGVVCMLLVGSVSLTLAGVSFTNRASDSPRSDTPIEIRPVPDIPVADDVELFREQLLTFLEESEGVILRLDALLVSDELSAQVDPSSGRVSTVVLALDSVLYADPSDLAAVRDRMAGVPGMLALPARVHAALDLLPPAGLSSKAACGDEYAEFRKIEVNTKVRNVLLGLADAVKLSKSIVFLIKDLVNASTTTCESPVDVPTSSIQVPFVIADGVFDILAIGLQFAADEVGFLITDSHVCIDSCVGHGFTDHHFPDTNAALAGKGCDNRDNNCAGGIDEPAEDRIAPVVTIDESLTATCYRSVQRARTAAEVAVKVEDDCSAVTPQVSFSHVPQACLGVFTVQAMDGASNAAFAGPVNLTIDPDPPVYVPAQLAACYPSLADARNAFGRTVVQDCTAVNTRLSAAENGCLAHLELEADDECGNRSSLTASVRLDGTAPEVEIDTIFLPRVDGLACFESVAEAIDTVREATRFSDNCSARSDLALDTIASGPECSLTVRSSAIDECGRLGTDSVRVRVDDAAPQVSCSVAREILWPADGTLHDVGFAFSATDDCDGNDLDLEFVVTSDESTFFGLKVQDEKGETDPAPDAEIDYDATGVATAIRLRAQRRADVGSDGRVYRIRVIATDSCGARSHADCFVAVPHHLESGSGDGFVFNSGQRFDATGVN